MNLSPEIKKQYFNTPQMEAMYIAANTTVIVGGRRLGKSHGFGAPFLLRNMKHMPGSSGGGSRDFLSATVDPYTPWYAERSPAMEHTARCTLLHRPKAPFIRQFQGTGYSSGQL